MSIKARSAVAGALAAAIALTSVAIEPARAAVINAAVGNNFARSAPYQPTDVSWRHRYYRRNNAAALATFAAIAGTIAAVAAAHHHGYGYPCAYGYCGPPAYPYPYYQPRYYPYW